MGLQSGRKQLAVCVLLMVAGALSSDSSHAQHSTGSLAGTLTDTHSTPLENVTVTLRNAITGAAISATTSRGGRYRFRDLAEGEYILAASGPRGNGEVGGIVVSSGHESHVQAVIEFPVSYKTSPTTSIASNESRSKDSAPESSR